MYRQDIAAAQLIANPGCYPTTVALGAMPLIELDALADPIIIADSKSGVSGAGRKPVQTTHFVEVNESLNPYGIGNVHRHVPEMNQTLNSIVGRGGTAGSTGGSTAGYKVIFSPQLLPISRGMLTMLYVTLTAAAAREDWQAIFAKRYEGEPFVRVLPKGQIATIAHTTHTNYAVLSVHTIADAPNRLLIVSCLDNLVKGASGQAVQNMNLMFGVDEVEGLK
jgi:N-acetyl-gamma-glutamyl-phosphate reductase